MSKVDAMRALKDARLEEQRRLVRAGGGTPSAPAVRRAAAAPATTPAAAPAAADGACGHRNIGGRACTRAAGHAEKSHRYG
jgi:hypothetical protein